METKRPPLGLKPRFLLNEERLKDVLNAIERYRQENMQIPPEWTEEKQELEEKLRDHKRIKAVNIMTTGNEDGVKIAYTGEDVMSIIDNATNKTYLGKIADVVSKIRENLYKETNAVTDRKKEENHGVYVMKGWDIRPGLDTFDHDQSGMEKKLRTLIQELRYKAVVLKEEEAKELATSAASDLSTILKGK